MKDCKHKELGYIEKVTVQWIKNRKTPNINLEVEMISGHCLISISGQDVRKMCRDNNIDVHMQYFDLDFIEALTGKPVIVGMDHLSGSPACHFNGFLYGSKISK